MNTVRLPFDDLNLPPALEFECHFDGTTQRVVDPVDVVLMQHKHPGVQVRVIMNEQVLRRHTRPRQTPSVC